MRNLFKALVVLVIVIICSCSEKIRTANVGPVVVSGLEDAPIVTEGMDIVITLANDSFRTNLKAEDSIKHWFLNLPEGETMDVRVKSVSENLQSVTAVASGVPARGRKGCIAILIPGDALSSGRDLAVAENTGAVWEILEFGVTSSITDIKDVLAKKDGTETETREIVLTLENITWKEDIAVGTDLNAVEGCEWIKAYSEGRLVTDANQVAISAVTVKTAAKAGENGITVVLEYIIKDNLPDLKFGIAVPSTALAGDPIRDLDTDISLAYKSCKLNFYRWDGVSDYVKIEGATINVDSGKMVNDDQLKHASNDNDHFMHIWMKYTGSDPDLPLSQPIQTGSADFSPFNYDTTNGLKTEVRVEDDMDLYAAYDPFATVNDVAVVATASTAGQTDDDHLLVVTLHNCYFKQANQNDTDVIALSFGDPTVNLIGKLKSSLTEGMKQAEFYVMWGALSTTTKTPLVVKINTDKCSVASGLTADGNLNATIMVN